MAPVEAVVFPAGQGVHWALETAPEKPLKVPRGHRLGEVAARPLYAPAGVAVHDEEPAREEYFPAPQGRHWDWELAPT